MAVSEEYLHVCDAGTPFLCLSLSPYSPCIQQFAQQGPVDAPHFTLMRELANATLIPCRSEICTCQFKADYTSQGVTEEDFKSEKFQRGTKIVLVIGGIPSVHLHERLRQFGTNASKTVFRVAKS